MGTRTESDLVSVSERALVKRCNRIIAKDNRKLMKNHPARSRAGKRRLTDREKEFGTFFVVKGGPRGKVVEHHVDLEELGRRCGALASYEYLEKPAR